MTDKTRNGTSLIEISAERIGSIGFDMSNPDLAAEELEQMLHEEAGVMINAQVTGWSLTFRVSSDQLVDTIKVLAKAGLVA